MHSLKISGVLLPCSLQGMMPHRVARTDGRHGRDAITMLQSVSELVVQHELLLVFMSRRVPYSSCKLMFAEILAI